MSQYFPKPYRKFQGNINVTVDLANYATKSDIKNATRVDTSKLAAKSDLARLKPEVDKIDVDKLKTVPVDLSKLSNAVNNDVVEKTVYDKLVIKVNNIDTSRFALKTKHDTDKSGLEKKISDPDKKIPNTSRLVKKTDHNGKITETESKILSIIGLATNYALTAVANKIPDITNLVKKTDYNPKILNIEKKATDHNCDKYITSSEFNKLTTENFAARLAQGNLVTNTDFDTKLISFNEKINSNKTKNLFVENELKKTKIILFEVKTILKMMAIKIISYFSQYRGILKKLKILIIFHHENLGDYLVKVSDFLLQLIIVLILY